MPLPRSLFLARCCVLVLACAGGACRVAPPVREAPELPPPPVVPTRVPLPTRDASELRAAQQQLQAAETLVAQTRKLIPQWRDGDDDLVRARAALSLGEVAEVRVGAREAMARAHEALSDHYARLANEELARSYAYSGLDDGQLLQLRAAEEILVTGNSRLAYGRLRRLNRQLENRVRTYSVRAGDSLWVIAGRPEVYANSLLWPLIWQANVTVIPNPDRLRRGQILKLKTHPSVQEIAEAVDTARGNRRKKPPAGTTTRIGEIREAGD